MDDIKFTVKKSEISDVGGPTGSGGKAAKAKISLGPGYSQLVLNLNIYYVFFFNYI